MRLRIVALAAVLVAAGAWLVWNAGGADAPAGAPERIAAADPVRAPFAAAAPRPAVPAARAPGSAGGPAAAEDTRVGDPVAGPEAGRTEAPVRDPSRERAFPPRSSSVPDGGTGPPPGADDPSVLQRLDPTRDETDGDADADDASLADRDATDRDLAERGEALGLLPPDQLEQWIDREVRRSGAERDTARQAVLSDLTLARYLAEKKAGPGATPQTLRPLVDQAMGLVPTLTPAVRARIAAEALAAL